uniref:Putative betalactamase n=1 Tax=termite gut metagenome TaxID=433724 RepID=S0DFL5_9ZZZZ
MFVDPGHLFVEGHPAVIQYDGIVRFGGMAIRWGLPPAERTREFIEGLKKLEKGKTYMYIEHPALDTDEMRGISHIGYENVAEDRQAVTDMFTSPEVKRIIEEKGIELVSYGDLVREYKYKGE